MEETFFGGGNWDFSCYFYIWCRFLHLDYEDLPVSVNFMIAGGDKISRYQEMEIRDMLVSNFHAKIIVAKNIRVNAIIILSHFLKYCN